MSQYVDGNTKTFTAGAAIGVNLRVYLSSGKLAAAGLTTREWIGTLLEESFADGDVRAVRLRSAAGTTKMVTADALTIGDPVFTQASGKVGDSESTGFYIGTALETVTTDGDTVEVLIATAPTVVS